MSRGFEVKSHKVVVDFFKQTGEMLSNSATFSQGDIGTSFIEVTLLNNDKAINLTGYTITINVTRKDRTRVVTTSEVLDIENGIIEIPISVEMLRAGVNQLEIILSKSGTHLVSPVIPYRVVKTMLDTSSDLEVMGQSEYPVLLQLVSDVEKLKTSYDAIQIGANDIEDILNMIN